jgi:hypothetical protein
MPRIFEATVGKVAGPLRMKVAPTATFSSSTTQTPKSKGHDRTPAISSNQEIRRGRYSRRNSNGLKKSRSKSLPSSKQASLLFGKPPDDDDSLQPASIDHSSKFKDSNIFVNRNLREATPKADFPTNSGDNTVDNLDPSDLTPSSDECRPSIALAGPSQQRHALAIDTRYLLNSTSNGSGKESFSAAESIVHNCKVLTKSLSSRGIAPCIVASTTASGKTRSYLHYTHENKRVATALADLGLGIETHKLVSGDNATLRKAMDLDDDTLYSRIAIPSTKLNSGASSISLPLHASYSWLLFSAMGTSQMRNFSVTSI